jgi:hypothetical protein
MNNKLNDNIPHFKAKIKKSYFTKNEEHSNDYYDVICFGIQSLAGKILTFHIMTDDGMMRSRVPLSEIYIKEPTKDIPFHFKQLWDCFSENVSVITYDYLYEKRCQVALKDGSKVWATYLMTVDWYRNPYSDEPSDYKCGHILIADDGYLLCQPNNRIYWKDSNWVTKPFPIEPSSLKVDTHIESVEAQSDKWVSEDSNNYYYEIKNTENKL